MAALFRVPPETGKKHTPGRFGAVEVPGSGRAVRVVNVLRAISIQEVPAGEYERMHLTVTGAEIVRDDDGDPGTPPVTEEVIVPPSKINVPVPFTLSQNEALDVILDFDAAASVQVHETGSAKYILRPVITPVGVKNP